MDGEEDQMGEVTYPGGLCLMQHHNQFFFNLKPKQASAFEILVKHDYEQLLLIGQNFFPLISLLESPSRAEVANIQLDHPSGLMISIPISTERATIENITTPFCKPNRMDIYNLQRDLLFTFVQGESLCYHDAFSYQILNGEKETGNLKRLNSSKLVLTFTDDSLSSEDKAVVFAGVSFIVCRKSHRTKYIVLILTLIVIIIIIVVYI